MKVSPPPAAACVRRWLLSSYTDMRLLRTALHDILGRQPVPDGHELDAVPEKVALIATELVTNALQHASTGLAEVELRRDEATYVLDVADSDPASVPALSGDRAPGAGSLGLRLVQQSATDIGWNVDSGVKHVWATLALPTV